MRGAGDRGGSFGLGLAIVTAVASSHGGTVTLETPRPFGPGQPARGARFVVRLPGNADADAELAPQEQEPVLADRAV